MTLNSSWKIDRFNRKRAGIHPEALANAIQVANNQIEEEKASGNLASDARVLRIGVWHHAVTGLEMMRNTEFLSHLRSSSVKLCLHGDVHEMRRDLIGYWRENNAMHIVGSGSFGSPAVGRPESTPRLYNLLEIDRNLSRVRVHTRRQMTSDGTWEGWYEWPDDSGNANIPHYDVDLSV